MDAAGSVRELEIEFWRAINPGLTIEGPSLPHIGAALPMSETLIAEARALLLREGYVQIPPLASSGLPLFVMATGVSNLVAQRYPAAFAFLYDEFWALFTQLNQFLGGVLGAEFKRLPDFWAWHVDPRKQESGWTPHRDKGHMSLFPDGSPKSLTVWVPLTEATPLNGCMYLVPADRDPVYGTPEDKERKFAMADIRALPAAPGTIFCWNQAILHWGGHASSRAAAPRISAAFEFQRADVPAFNQPLMEANSIPGFEWRKRLIGKQVLQYRHMYPLTPELELLATRMLQQPQAA